MFAGVKQAAPSQGKLGTFAGVFTPSILTILGIILFLRLGYVVGRSGLYAALLIILLANAISVLTSFSVSAIATNLKVKAGGDYYLISRTLGIGFGGAIGVVLFFAQTISVAFYCIGFGEAVAALLGHEGVGVQMVAAGAVLGLFVLAWLGSDWATRFQYVVMALIFAALASFVFGALGMFDAGQVTENWTVRSTRCPSGPLSRSSFRRSPVSRRASACRAISPTRGEAFRAARSSRWGSRSSSISASPF